MKIVSNVLQSLLMKMPSLNLTPKDILKSMLDTRKKKKEQWYFCKLYALIVNDLESSLFLKQTFLKSLMAYSSIHLLHCTFFEVQVACNVMLQQLMKFLNLSYSFMLCWMVKRGYHL